MKILLACSAGMSTSLLEKSMNDYIKENGFNDSVEAHASEAAKSIINDFDVVLLGPQVRYLKASFEELSKGAPIGVIPPQDYALAKGENVYKYAKEVFGK